MIEVEIELDELDLTSAEIKDYVRKEHGLKVSNIVTGNRNIKKKLWTRRNVCDEEFT